MLTFNNKAIKTNNKSQRIFQLRECKIKFPALFQKLLINDRTNILNKFTNIMKETV